MAEGVHHRDHAPGILVGTVGPGTLNGVNTVANAFQDQVPLIVLAGSVDADEAQRYTHQVVDQRDVFKPITKATFTLTAGAAHTIADKAVGIATEGRHGPVFIDVPVGVADTLIDGPVPTRRAPASPVAPAGAALDTARGWLAGAKRPVMIVGADALNQHCGAEVTRFAETHNIPVITTYKAKGMLAEDHPLSLGGAGLSPLADTHLLPLVKSADLVICLGYDPVEMRPGWRDVWDPDRQNVIDITAAPNHHYMHQSSLNFVADCAASLHVDNSLALIEKKQRERQMTNRGVDFAPHDYAAIGAAFGGHGVTVRDRAGLETALKDAMQADRFTLIAAEIDKGAYDGRI